MKKSTLYAWLAVMLSFGILSAQDAPTAGASAPVPARGPATAPAKLPLPPPLKENIRLNVKAEMADGYPMEVGITGCGPEFSANVIIQPTKAANSPDKPAFANLQMVVTQAEGGYQVEFSLNYSVPAPSQNGAPSAYTNLSTKSTVMAKLGTPVEITAANGKKATLSISTPTGK